MTDEEKIKELQHKLAIYEENGAAKMYYALNRKMNEIGDLFNKTSLNTINLDDPKDKSFDRVFKLIEKSEVVANAAKALKDFGGITGNEELDVSQKPFVETIAIKRN